MTRQIVMSAAALLLLGEVMLLVLGGRILVSETRVEPGQLYVVPNYGNLGEAQQAQLACKYFTGRKVIVKVFWYAPNNFMGRDECPFLLSQDEI